MCDASSFRFLPNFSVIVLFCTYTNTCLLIHTQAHTHTRVHTHFLLHFVQRLSHAPLLMMIHTHLFTLRRLLLLLLLLLLLFDLDYSCSKSGLVVLLLLVVLRMKVTKKHLTACEAFEAFSALLRSSFLRFFRILAFLTMIMAMFLPHLCHFFPHWLLCKQDFSRNSRAGV